MNENQRLQRENARHVRRVALPLESIVSTIIKLVLTAIVAWLIGIGAIAVSLYFGNGGADFTLVDIMGFGVLYVVASAVLMLLVYLPALFWFRRRTDRPFWYPLFSGLLLNLPIFALLGILIGRKLAASEAITFMFVFFITGSIFGVGFFRVTRRGHTNTPLS